MNFKFNKNLVNAMVDKLLLQKAIITSNSNNSKIADAKKVIPDVMIDFEEYEKSGFSDGVEKKLCEKYGINTHETSWGEIRLGSKAARATSFALVTALGFSFIGCKSNNNYQISAAMPMGMERIISDDETSFNAVSITNNLHDKYLNSTVNTGIKSESVISTTNMSVNSQELASLEELNEEYCEFGEILINGMTRSDYDSAMNIPWSQISVSGTPETMDVNLLEEINYAKIESILYNMAKYDGVSLYDIGDSEQGRNIYKVILDLNGPATSGNKQTILLTGGVHAREFAGTDFLLKSLNDLLIKSQTDSYLRGLLENIRIICVPCVNPDGRELVINGDTKRKSNANGVDLGRNMPSLNAGQLANGVKKEKDISNIPGLDFFPGYNLGSESESQAMIKFFITYVPIARYYVDHHQMGNYTYKGKPFLSKQCDKNSSALASYINKSLKGHYSPKSEASIYGINGDGGTMSDFACGVAEGMQFSYKFGQQVMIINGEETPLICFRDVDKLGYYTPANKYFGYATIEIGSGAGSRGNSPSAREKRNKDYNRYNWENYLQNLIEFTLGNKKIDQIKRTSTISTLEGLRENLIILKNYSESEESQLIYTKTF